MWKDLSLWSLFLATFTSWAAWAVVINKISPFESPQIAVPAFYTTLFFSLTTTFTVIGSLLRKFAAPGRHMLSCINISLRQGVILSAICLFSIWLEQMNVFTWWIGALLLVIGLILEFLFWETKR